MNKNNLSTLPDIWRPKSFLSQRTVEIIKRTAFGLMLALSGSACGNGKVDSYAHKNIAIVPGGDLSPEEAKEAQRRLDCLYNQFRSTPYIENAEQRNAVIENIINTRDDVLYHSNISPNTMSWYLKRESLGNGAFKTYSTNKINKSACERSINCEFLNKKPTQMSNEACEQYAVQ